MLQTRGLEIISKILLFLFFSPHITGGINTRDIGKYNEVLKNGAGELSYRCIFDANGEINGVLLTINGVTLNMSISYFLELKESICTECALNITSCAITCIRDLYAKINALDDSKKMFIMAYSRIDDSFEAIKEITEALHWLPKSEFNAIRNKLNGTLHKLIAKYDKDEFDYWMYKEIVMWIINNPRKASDTSVILYVKTYPKGTHNTMPIYVDTRIEYRENDYNLPSVYIDGLLVKTFIVKRSALDLLQKLKDLQDFAKNAEPDCIYTYLVK